MSNLEAAEHVVSGAWSGYNQQEYIGPVCGDLQLKLSSVTAGFLILSFLGGLSLLPLESRAILPLTSVEAQQGPEELKRVQ